MAINSLFHLLLPLIPVLICNQDGSGRFATERFVKINVIKVGNHNRDNGRNRRLCVSVHI